VSTKSNNLFSNILKDLKMKNKFLLLSAAILFAFTPMHAGAAKTEVKSSITVTIGKTASLDQVQQYMSDYGIIIVGMSTITGTENVYARDDKGSTYIIYISNGIWNGWDHVDY
jgi:hypothetical protein